MKLDLPPADRRVRTQLNASQKRAEDLKAANFNCCTFKDGTACTGAGRLINEEGETRLMCGNNCGGNRGHQRASLMSAEEAARCSKSSKKKHHKTPLG